MEFVRKNQRVIGKEIQDNDRDIRPAEREFEQIYTEHLEFQIEVEKQTEKMRVITSN